MMGEPLKYLFKLLLIACSFDRDLVAEIFYDCWMGLTIRHSSKSALIW